MHTTALLAGAAATAVPEAQLREGRRRDLSGVTGERGMWVPVQFWDGGDEGDGKGVRGGDVRGEKVLVADFEAELEEKEDEDVELQGKIEGYGVRDVLERVWKTVEKIGTVVRRRKQRMERDKELDNGHDGDL